MSVGSGEWGEKEWSVRKKKKRKRESEQMTTLGTEYSTCGFLSPFNSTRVFCKHLEGLNSARGQRGASERTLFTLVSNSSEHALCVWYILFCANGCPPHMLLC